MTDPCDALAALLPVVAELRRLGVRHYICGSLASVVYGTPRATTDVDLVASLDASKVSEFVAGLGKRYYADERMIRDAVARRSCFNVIFLPTSFKVDVFVPKDRPYDREAMQRIHEDQLGETGPHARFFLPSAEDVVLSKLEWYRLGDEVSERQWQDVLGVLKVNGASLDRRYLGHWAGELGVADLLARAWAEVEITRR
jgi:hypothetical protein